MRKLDPAPAQRLILSGDAEPGIVVNGPLELNLTVNSLPENLTVFGNLILRHSHIDRLPSGLTVHGNLDLRWTDITELPADLWVAGAILMDHMQLPTAR